MLDSRIVDENIDPSQLARRLRDHALDRHGTRRIGSVINCLDAMGIGQRFACLFDLRGLAETVKEDVGALRRERLSDPEADATRGAGHDCDPIGQLLHGNTFGFTVGSPSFRVI